MNWIKHYYSWGHIYSMQARPMPSCSVCVWRVCSGGSIQNTLGATLMHWPHPAPIPRRSPLVGLTCIQDKKLSLGGGAWRRLATSLCDVTSAALCVQLSWSLSMMLLKCRPVVICSQCSSGIVRLMDCYHCHCIWRKTCHSHIIVEHPVRCCRLVSYFEYFSSVHIDLIPQANTSVYVTVSVKKLCRLDYCFYWLLIF